MSTNLMPTVTAIDGKPTTTSLDIATRFGKLHKNVIQSIERLESPEDFNRLNFQPVEYSDSKGEKRPQYLITRDGFTILAMGFTGKRAMEWKIKYIEAFNRMEAELRKPAPQPKPKKLRDGTEARTVWLPKSLLDDLDRDADRGKRSPNHHLESILRLYFGETIPNVKAFPRAIPQKGESVRTICLPDDLWVQIDRQGAKVKEPWEVQILRIIEAYFTALITPNSPIRVIHGFRQIRLDYPATNLFREHDQTIPLYWMNEKGHLTLPLHFVLGLRLCPVENLFKKLEAEGHNLQACRLVHGAHRHYLAKLRDALAELRTGDFDTGLTALKS